MIKQSGLSKTLKPLGTSLPRMWRWRPNSILRRRRFTWRRLPPLRLNEFYKKGCQEKSSPSTGGREDFVSRSSPLHCKSASRFAREVLLLSCLPFLELSSSGGDHANRVMRHGKRDGYLSGNHSSIGGSGPIRISC